MAVGNTGNPDNVLPAPDSVQFVTVAALVAAFEVGGAHYGRIPRMVRTMTDGAIQIATAGNPTLREWVFAANVDEPLQFTRFAASAGTPVVPSETAPIKVYF